MKKLVKRSGVFIAALMTAACFFACGKGGSSSGPKTPVQGTNDFSDITTANGLLDAAALALSSVDIHEFAGEESGTSGGAAAEKKPYGLIGRLPYLQDAVLAVSSRIGSEMAAATDAALGEIPELNKWVDFSVPEGVGALKNAADRYRLSYTPADIGTDGAEANAETDSVEYIHTNSERGAEYLHYLYAEAGLSGDITLVECQIDDAVYLKLVPGSELTLLYKGSLHRLAVKNDGGTEKLAYFEYDADMEAVTSVIFGNAADGFLTADAVRAGTFDAVAARVRFLKDGHTVAEYTTRKEFRIGLYALSGIFERHADTGYREEAFSSDAEYLPASRAVFPYDVTEYLVNDAETTLLPAGTPTGEGELDLQYAAEDGDALGYFEGADTLLIKYDEALGSDDRVIPEFEKRLSDIEGLLSRAGLSWNEERAGTLSSVLESIRNSLRVVVTGARDYRTLSYGASGYPAKVLSLFDVVPAGTVADVDNSNIKSLLKEHFDGVLKITGADIAAFETDGDKVSRWDYAGAIRARGDCFTGFAVPVVTETDAGFAFTLALPAARGTLEELGLDGAGYTKAEYSLWLSPAATADADIPSYSLGRIDASGTQTGFSISSEDIEALELSKGRYYLKVLLSVTDGEGAETVLSEKTIDVFSTDGFSRFASTTSEGGGLGINSFFYFGKNAETDCFVTVV